ncbi:hypothetical protein [Sphingomonas sp. NPDC079357]|uniref:hypothetical protein n=1 Tax=Sphingomonas sp. NPDC079357 TaxID=3364518 RepID=UPI00384FB6B5
MIVLALYILFFAVAAGFMWWRFYVSIQDQIATVKWAKYRRSGEPIAYWLSTSMMMIGALLTSSIALIFGYGLLAGFIG